jgi:hypothetical protein
MLHEARRFASCAETSFVLIAKKSSCRRPKEGRFLSAATHAANRQTQPDPEKITAGKPTQDICVFACIAIANGLLGIRSPGFAAGTANTLRAAAGWS